jgi:hypothetical protein
MNEHCLLGLILGRYVPRWLAATIRYQEEVVRVMCVLPGKYRYEQVKAAINAAGVHPMDIYESLLANQCTFALARFYEALNGPTKTGHRGGKGEKIMATQKQPAGIGTRDKNGRKIAVGDIVRYMAGSKRHIPQEYLVENVPAPDIFHAMDRDDGRLQDIYVRLFEFEQWGEVIGTAAESNS